VERPLREAHARLARPEELFDLLLPVRPMLGREHDRICRTETGSSETTGRAHDSTMQNLPHRDGTELTHPTNTCWAGDGGAGDRNVSNPLA
jgi:hypothetical protein